MPRRIESLLLDGPAGRLEALLEEPDEQAPQGAALVCHPHPLHGGTMHNKVVYRLARGLRRAGSVVLRFNFRGVNLSGGQHDEGRGEVDDARAAAAFLLQKYPGLPLSLAGFSFGSRVALRLGCSMSNPAPVRLLAAGFPTVYRDFEFLRSCSLPKTFVQSTNDKFGPKEELEDLVGTLRNTEVHWIESKDHFFVDALDALEATVIRVASAATQTARDSA